MGAMYKIIFETFLLLDCFENSSREFFLFIHIFELITSLHYKGVTQIIGNIVANVTKYLCAPTLLPTLP